MPPGPRLSHDEPLREIQALGFGAIQRDIEPAASEMTARGGQHGPCEKRSVFPLCPADDRFLHELVSQCTMSSAKRAARQPTSAPAIVHGSASAAAIHCCRLASSSTIVM